ncbi:MAG: NAD(P)/FAD-dependent oxidoreductase [Chloroflexota bacterium]
MADVKVFDITIIGAGPTGLFAAFYAGMRQMETKIIETLPEMGGQLAVLYPEKYIYDVPGFPKVLAKDLVKGLVEQAMQWGPAVHLEECVQTLHFSEPGQGDFMILRSDKGVHYTRSILIAAGIGAFVPNKLKNETIEEFEGRGVYYFVKDKTPLRNKRVLVVGGGDSAVDWALNLKDWASEVTLIHRRDKFRAHEASVVELNNSPVNLKLHYEVDTVHGKGRVDGVTIFNNQTGKKEYLKVDFVLMNLGFKADLGPIKDWGLPRKKRYLIVDECQQTDIAGVFAAGDVCAQPNIEPLNLIATGFGQATVAVNYAKHYIDPEARVFPGHSSELKL